MQTNFVTLTQRMNILYLYLSINYNGMKYDTLYFLGGKITIWFSFLAFLAFIEVYVLAIATCVICFIGKILRVLTSVVIKN